MKKFKFFALAFAALSFAACSDDALDGKGGNSGSAGDGTPAYLTISFTANGGSSSRADDDNTGDNHGDQDDSGHHNSGTLDERTVNQALVVVMPLNKSNAGFAKLYSTQTNTVTGTDPDPDEFTIVDKTSGTYVNTNPIEVSIGQYNVLVVANPVSTLTNDDEISATLSTQLATGVTDLDIVEALYKKIVEKDYTPDETEYKKIANGDILKTTTTGEGEGATPIPAAGIMMANKALNDKGEAFSIELTENDSEDTPATVNIEVERVYSKITYRTIKENNVYPVTVNNLTVVPQTVEGAILVEEEEGGEQEEPATPTYRKVTLSIAHDACQPNRNTVYVLYEKVGDAELATFQGVYRETTQKVSVTGETGTFTLYEAITPTTQDEYKNESNKYVVEDTDNPESSLTILSKEVVDEENPTTWYVKLEGYALVNLSKGVHYVRQITDAQGGHDAFGTLNGGNFLYTTNWAAKNGVDLNVEAPNEPDFSDAGDWFYNTLAEVSTESESLTFDASGALKNPTYFKSFSTLVDETSTNSGTVHGTETTVGQRMAYVFENSTDIEHQVHGLSTGIAFVARVYESYTDETTNKPLDTPLYYYANHTFGSLGAILKAYGEGNMSEEFKELVQKEENEEPITQDDLIALADADNGGENIILYNGNTCFYYTTEIKHFDNGDNSTLGNMEYAIMRNNIYSLAVTSIEEIGTPFVDSTGDIPNESGKAALNVETKILPWIVRYSDIEFK